MDLELIKSDIHRIGSVAKVFTKSPMSMDSVSNCVLQSKESYLKAVRLSYFPEKYLFL